MKKVILLISAVALLTTGNVYAQTHHHHQETSKADSAKARQAGANEARLTVQGSCGMCKTRIEKAAKGVAGVSSASWDAKSKTLQVRFDAGKTPVDAVAKALAKAGHDTEQYRADDRTYNALPQCCKYRKQ